MLFHDRTDAGQVLAQRLSDYAGRPDVVVLALPRGGVPVGAEVAETLHAPLDVFMVRKLGTPGHEELAMGAIATGNVRVLNDDVIRAHGISQREIDAAVAREQVELRRREWLYRGDQPPRDISGQTVILVDDGLATGSTMQAAVAALRQQHPAEIVVAVPVGAPETCREFQTIADHVVCAHTPPMFTAVGQWYDDFSQTTDDEVRALLPQPATSSV